MTGREVILTNRSFTPDELFQFMEEHWDKEQYSDFVLGSPTDPNARLYVMLPATARHLVIVYYSSYMTADRKTTPVGCFFCLHTRLIYIAYINISYINLCIFN